MIMEWIKETEVNVCSFQEKFYQQKYSVYVVFR